VTLLGTGGTAQAAGAALLAAGVPRLAIAGRRPDAAAALARRLAPLAPAAVVEGGGLPPGGRLGLLVHCTPVGGLTAVEHLPLPADEIRRVDALADFAYRPDGSPTPLVAAAAAARVPVVDGLELLVRQGTRSFELLTGVAAPVAVMRAAARASTVGADA
jgi:shikimate dehydrogenase